MANPITTSVPALPQDGSVPRSGSQPATSSADGVRQSTAPSGNTAPASAQPVRQETESAQELAQATRDISEYIQTVSRNLDISVDDELGRTVITVLDAKTEEVVRQIPSEEIMAIARFLKQQQAESEANDTLKGVIINREG